MDLRRPGRGGDRTRPFDRPGEMSGGRSPGRRAGARRDTGPPRPAAAVDRPGPGSPREEGGPCHREAVDGPEAPMTELRHTQITGIGSALPERVVPNLWFESFVDTD